MHVLALFWLFHMSLRWVFVTYLSSLFSLFFFLFFSFISYQSAFFSRFLLTENYSVVEEQTKFFANKLSDLY